MALVELYLLQSADVEESETDAEESEIPTHQQTVANTVRPVPDVVITV